MVVEPAVKMAKGNNAKCTFVLVVEDRFVLSKKNNNIMF